MGRGVACDLAKRGWKVVILDYNRQEGEQVAVDIDADFFEVDVRSWKQQYEAFEVIFQRYGRIDFGE